MRDEYIMMNVEFAKETTCGFAPPTVRLLKFFPQLRQ